MPNISLLYHLIIGFSFDDRLMTAGFGKTCKTCKYKCFDLKEIGLVMFHSRLMKQKLNNQMAKLLVVGCIIIYDHCPISGSAGFQPGRKSLE